MPIRTRAADLTLEDLDRIKADSGNSNFLGEIGNAARGFVCELYKDNPNAIIPNFPGVDAIFDPNGASSARHALLERMCRPINKVPDPPPIRYTGGQCPVGYEVRATVNRAYKFNNELRFDSVIKSEVFWGEIGDVFLTGSTLLKVGSTVLKTFRYIRCQCYGGYFGQRGQQQVITFGGSTADDDGYTSISNIEINRLDGQPDNCGDPRPRYPDKISPVTNYNNTVNLKVDNNTNIVAPITIIPTVIAPVTNVFSPQIHVDVGGIRVGFDLGGVTFDNVKPLPPGSDLNNDPREFPPNPVSNDNSIDLGGSDVDLTPVTQLLTKIDDELHKCCNRNYPYPFPEGASVTSLGNGNSGTVDLPERCFAVKVQITSDLNKMDVQSGDDGVSVYQAGWVNFLNAEIPMPREPIAASANYYTVPERFSGSFAWKMRKDYTCNVSCYTSTKDN